MWNLPVEERLREWKKFRLDLLPHDVLHCLNEVAKLWATAPLCNQFLAYDLPNTWPSPWDLIVDNHYDDIGIALGIFYTLSLEKIQECKIQILEHKENIYSVVNYQNQILNYDVGNVINIKQLPTNIKIIHEYKKEDLKIKN